MDRFTALLLTLISSSVAFLLLLSRHRGHYSHTLSLQGTAPAFYESLPFKTFLNQILCETLTYTSNTTLASVHGKMNCWNSKQPAGMAGLVKQTQ